MAIDFEEVLAGEHGEAATAVAEQRVTDAIGQIAKMFDGGKMIGVDFELGGFANGGKFTPTHVGVVPRVSRGEAIIPAKSRA